MGSFAPDWIGDGSDNVAEPRRLNRECTEVINNAFNLSDDAAHVFGLLQDVGYQEADRPFGRRPKRDFEQMGLLADGFGHDRKVVGCTCFRPGSEQDVLDRQILRPVSIAVKFGLDISVTDGPSGE